MQKLPEKMSGQFLTTRLFYTREGLDTLTGIVRLKLCFEFHAIGRHENGIVRLKLYFDFHLGAFAYKNIHN